MSKIKELPKDLLQELGQYSDFAIAARYRVSPTAVREARENRDIAPVSAQFNRQAIEWTAERDKLLGTMPDTVLARRLGTSNTIVYFRRGKLGVTRYERPPLRKHDSPRSPHQWTEHKDALLGTDFDNALAEKFGCHATTVSMRRYQLGIEPYRRCDRIDWTDEMLRNLGLVSDPQFAHYYGISPSSVRFMRIALGIPNSLGNMSPVPKLPHDAYDLLGKWYDIEIAVKFDLNRATIRQVRMVLGIEAPKPVTATHFDWDTQSDALIGTDSDGNIAARLDIPHAQVRYRREKLGIAAYGYTDKVNWDEAKMSQLGKHPDRVLAQRFRCSTEAVEQKRKSQKISKRKKVHRWLQSEIATLGSASDSKVASLLGISPSSVRGKRHELNISAFKKPKTIRWTKGRLAQLGLITDKELAFKMQVNPGTVSHKRTSLGIARAPVNTQSWADERNRQLLGTMSDGQLASKLGVTPSAVRLKRVAMDIAAYKP